MTEATTSAPSTPEKASAPETLSALAAQKHSAFAAKINGSVFGKERHALQERYDVAETAYINAVRAEVSEQLESTEFSTIDQKIDQFEGLVNERIAQDREAQQNELIAQGGKRAKFLSWYTDLPRPKKLAVTVGLAAGGAAAGFVATSLGASVAAVAAGVGAYRLARGYNIGVSKLYSSRNEQPVYIADRETFNDESIDRAMAFLRKDSQSTIERAEKIKKRAVIGAVGALAIGSAAGYGLREVTEGTVVTEKTSQWAERLQGMFTSTAHAAEITDPIASPLNTVQGVEAPINDNLSGRNADIYGRAELSAIPTIEHVEKPTIAGSFTVEQGHGYTHELMETVKEAYGVELSKQEAWDLHKELVRTAGSDYINLLDHKGSDVYSMGDSRYEVGISDDGKAEWSDKAIKVLDEKFVSDETSADVDAEISPETNTTTRVIERNQVIGTGGHDFDSSSETPSTADNGTDSSRNLVQGTGGTDFNTGQPETPTAEATNEPSGITDARTAQEQGTDGISWDDMKNDAYEMRGMLLAGDIASINDDVTFQNTLEYIQKDIGNMTYPGSDVKIIEKTGSDFTSQWIVNDMPKGVDHMPPKVVEVFDRYINALRTLAP